jgi:hypothetical protein
VNVRVTGGAVVGKGTVPHRFTGSGGKSIVHAPMTLGAEEPSVLPRQLVVGVAVMLEDERRGVEPLRGMAGRAGLVELPQMNILMAGSAARLQRLVSDRLHDASGKSTFFRRMALGAGDAGVLSSERIAGLVMGERSRFEPLDGVATRAVIDELTDMRISPVAVTACGESYLPEGVGPVALCALQTLVPPKQGVAGAAVIEGLDLPGAHLVTAFAVRSQAGAVFVAVAVAAVREAQPYPLPAGMALLAADSSMRPEEGEARLVVIERNLVEDNLEGVALLAVQAELPVVPVAVAGDAASIVEKVSRSLVSRGSVGGLVTFVAASHVPVPPQERIAGGGMVEASGVPGNEPDVFPLMLGVTGGTLLRFVAVKSSSRLDAGRELLVAVEALRARLALAGRVTRDALLQPGKLRVRGTERSRRHQEVESLSLGSARGGESNAGNPARQNPPFAHHHLSP